MPTRCLDSFIELTWTQGQLSTMRTLMMASSFQQVVYSCPCVGTGCRHSQICLNHAPSRKSREYPRPISANCRMPHLFHWLQTQMYLFHILSLLRSAELAESSK